MRFTWLSVVAGVVLPGITMLLGATPLMGAPGRPLMRAAAVPALRT